MEGDVLVIITMVFAFMVWGVFTFLAIVYDIREAEKRSKEREEWHKQEALKKLREGRF